MKLTRRRQHPEAVKSFHMSFLETHRDDGFQDVTFLYKVGPSTCFSRRFSLIP